jgi:toxin ParE1/3/4
MRKVKYRIRAAAVKDLEGIWEYTIRKWSKDQADRYHSLIINEIEYVANHKTVGKDMSHVKEGYLVTYVKSHMIFFKRQRGIVHVIRILHQKMDIESSLK